MMKLQEKLIEVQKNKQAILAANFYNLETLKAIVSASNELKCPVILQLTQSSISYMGLKVATAMARSAIQDSDIEAWIHLDHARSIGLVKECLDAGFDSVMYDASDLTYEENTANTRQVVSMASKYGVNVEAELGYIAKLGQSSDNVSFTDPEKAAEFVKNTGINALAVAIGTAHGFYKKPPKLDFERLTLIHRSTDACLVLHGGSGIPDSDLIESVRRGICKINLATEIKNTFIREIKTLLSQTDDIDLRNIFPPAIKTVTALVKNKMEVISKPN